MLSSPAQVARSILEFCNQPLSFADILRDTLTSSLSVEAFVNTAHSHGMTQEALRCVIAVANLTTPL